MVAVRLTPKAAGNRIAGNMREASGERILKVSVTAAPEAGKANAALLKLLAAAWKLPKSSLAVVAGLTARRKVVLVRGEPDALIARLKEWGKTLP
ncbi:MAG: DUF167 domain-containing protein [Rhodospirillales bacterium]|nr:MAG: DUF167 domain-containing protein [Rhodospirillales bacterium]